MMEELELTTGSNSGKGDDRKLSWMAERLPSSWLQGKPPRSYAPETLQQQRQAPRGHSACMSPTYRLTETLAPLVMHVGAGSPGAFAQC